MATATMNRNELNNDELDMLFGSLNCPQNISLARTCKKCGKDYLPFLSHKCLVYPKMDVDNRPAVTPPPFHPVHPQA